MQAAQVYRRNQQDDAHGDHALHRKLEGKQTQRQTEERGGLLQAGAVVRLDVVVGG